MARPIWNGTLSFGLLHVPVALMPGERRTDLSFRMLDNRDNAPIRYERVNSETGEEVPWSQIVKAYEYDKDSYVVLEEEDIRAASSDGRESVDIEGFVEIGAIPPQYYEKPYILVPAKKAEKGYVLLRETLASTGRAGIARVVIRTREYLAAVMAQGPAIVLMLLRFPQELINVDDYRLPEGEPKDFRIVKRELDMARQLIESMTAAWSPDDYRDEFRERLHDVIKKRMKSKGLVAAPDTDEPKVRDDAATNVVDFMALLEKSIKDNRRTPASKSSRAAPAKRGKASKTAKAAKAVKSKPTSKTATKAAGKKTDAPTKARPRKKAS